MVADAGRQGHPDGLPCAGAVARGAEDYLRRLRRRCWTRPAARSSCTGWAPMFDPALTGYWGSDDVAAATETFLELIRAHPEQGRRRQGLPAGRRPRDRRCARRSPDGVRLYTGDDFNYPELIHGDGTRHSDALLGIFAGIYPAASAALQAYDAGEPGRGAGDPGLHRGARAAHLQRPDLLLQDRHRVPVLAQRPPARVPDGRRPALGPLRAAPGRDLQARRPGRAAARPGARRAADGTCSTWRDGAPASHRPRAGRQHRRCG